MMMMIRMKGMMMMMMLPMIMTICFQILTVQRRAIAPMNVLLFLSF